MARVTTTATTTAPRGRGGGRGGGGGGTPARPAGATAADVDVGSAEPAISSSFRRRAESSQSNGLSRGIAGGGTAREDRVEDSGRRASAPEVATARVTRQGRPPSPAAAAGTSGSPSHEPFVAPGSSRPPSTCDGGTSSAPPPANRCRRCCRLTPAGWPRHALHRARRTPSRPPPPPPTSSQRRRATRSRRARPRAS